MKTKPPSETTARKIPRRFVRHASTFVIVCVFLAFANRMTSPDHWRLLWIIAGWGLSLATSLIHHRIGTDKDERY